ncbi:MAG: D-alanyl-D-alanine carboxypeptidase [Armatimonadetes bacterium]|nr:D-alanyl-D-alanine carboxypeptidase [Armatimonadota bacterium]
MRKAAYPLFIFLFFAFSAAQAQGPQVGSRIYVLMDARTGQVLAEKNSRLRRPPASTTKIMTAIVALENVGLDDIVTVGKSAAETPYSSMNFKPGEKIKMRDLLYGMLLRSANDSCVAVAEHISGSVEKFVEMMNRRALELGCRDTRFVNPNGLHAPGHYTSAYDLALIARHAALIPEFNEFVRTQKKKIERSLNRQDIVVRNKCVRFLKHYKGADGIKTGYTRQAGHCFVGSATRGDWRLISVILKSPNIGVDTENLLDYGFQAFQPLWYARKGEPMQEVPVAGGRTPLTALSERDGCLAVFRKSRPRLKKEVRLEPVEAPVSAGQRVGTVRVSVNGRSVDEIALVADRSVERTFFAGVWHWMKGWGLAIALMAVGVRVGGTIAKNSRSRRGRFSKRF